MCVAFFSRTRWFVRQQTTLSENLNINKSGCNTRCESKAMAHCMGMLLLLMMMMMT